MTDPSLPPIRMWSTAPLGHEVTEALGRLQHAPDVQQIAVMPDVHLANEICVGVVLATSRLIYPQAVGGDIGCGMLAVATNSTPERLRDPKAAGQILAGLAKAIPSRRRNRQAVFAQPQDLDSIELSNARLESIRRGEGALEFATLGSGNHFLEIQADEEDQLWLMIHSGSRALGQAIRDHHLSAARIVEGRFRALDAESEQGAAYLHDLDWARRYAAASRRAMAAETEKVIQDVIGARLHWETSITTDHNHVALEQHGGSKLWVHRKGAMALQAGELGVLPGSMGTLSFHVEGRGCEEALNSSAHGAGRAMSRSEAARKVSRAELQRQMKGVWFDWRLADAIRDESPSAYKDIDAVHRGGIERLRAMQTDVCEIAFPDTSFDGVTILEVLEHLHNPEVALDQALRMARRFVIASVPSTSDDNPEHRHLFTVDRLKDMAVAGGCAQPKIEHVLNHRILICIKP